MAEVLKLKFCFILMLSFVSATTPPCEKAKLYEQVSSPYNNTKIVNGVKAHQLCSYEKLVWEDNSAFLAQATCNFDPSRNNQVSSKNIPWKMLIVKDYLYLFVERIHPGTYCSLNRLPLSHFVNDNGKNSDGSVKCPALECYPNSPSAQFFDTTTCADTVPTIINAKGVYHDDCNSIWVFDSGCYFDGTEHVCPRLSSLLQFDENDVLINTIELPNEYSYETWSAMVVYDKCFDCTDAPNELYFYFINNARFFILVYYLKDNQFYKVQSYQFRPAPSQSSFEITLRNYRNHKFINPKGIDAVIKGNRGLYYHRGAGIDVSHISYPTLNNQTIAESDELHYNIKKIGSFNCDGQSTGMIMIGDLFFFLQIQNGAVACVNKKAGVNPDAFQLITVDKKIFSSACSIQVYHGRTDCQKIIILSNNERDIKLNGMNENVPNFILSYIYVKDVDAIYPECKAHFSELYGNHHQPGHYFQQNPADRESFEKFYRASAILTQNQKNNNKKHYDLPHESSGNEALYYTLLAQQQKAPYKNDQKPVVYAK